MATESRYPQWDARYDELEAQAEREIEEWYKANADLGGHRAADATAPTAEPAPEFPSSRSSWLERVGEELQVLFNDVGDRLRQNFSADEHDEPARAEHAAAWEDRAHWQGRLEQTVRRMDEQGKFRY
jgi:hypothetical protein